MKTTVVPEILELGTVSESKSSFGKGVFIIKRMKTTSRLPEKQITSDVDEGSPTVLASESVTAQHENVIKHNSVEELIVQDYLHILNYASRERLEKLPGIGESRLSYILNLREASAQPFKSLDDVLNIGVSEKEARTLVKMFAMREYFKECK